MFVSSPRRLGLPHPLLRFLLSVQSAAQASRSLTAKYIPALVVYMVLARARAAIACGAVNVQD